MKIRTCGACAVLLVAVLSVASAVTAAEAKDTGKVMMWEATSDAGTAYILGSLHFGSDELYPLNPAIDDAYAKSGTLVLEMSMDMASQLQAAGLMQKEGMYTGDETLSSHLSAEERTKLDAYLKERGIQMAAVDKMKPWLVMTLLAVKEMTDLGYDPELGLDTHFYEKAAAAGKSVQGLETPEEQVGILTEALVPIQVKELMDLVDEASKTKKIFGDFLAAWKGGDTAAMKAAIDENTPKDPDVKAAETKIIDERNTRLADRLVKLVTPEKPIFVIVGAAHLVSDNNIPKLLEAKGFKVTQVEKKPMPKSPAMESSGTAIESSAPVLGSTDNATSASGRR
jgi:uncharacterized protein